MNVFEDNRHKIFFKNNYHKWHKKRTRQNIYLRKENIFTKFIRPLLQRSFVRSFLHPNMFSNRGTVTRKSKGTSLKADNYIKNKNYFYRTEKNMHAHCF